ncbi:MAG: hypothetical protein WKF73_06385 [Nocardioidaceae bacterium]
MSTTETDHSTKGSYVESGQDFKRDTQYITDRITAHGGDGYPVEAGRYHLVVARACPWANRAIIVRRLLGLEGVLSMGVCGPTHDKRSWTFDLDLGRCRPGPRHRASPGRILRQVPRLLPGHHSSGHRRHTDWSGRDERLPPNDAGPVARVAGVPPRGCPDLYPEQQRAEIDEVIDVVFRDVNNGVYRCGFAGSQEAYGRAYDQLFARLDWLSDRLSSAALPRW